MNLIYLIGSICCIVGGIIIWFLPHKARGLERVITRVLSIYLAIFGVLYLLLALFPNKP